MIVRRHFCSKRLLSTIPRPAKPENDAILEWLTSSSSRTPPINSNFTISTKKSLIQVTSNGEPQPIPHNSSLYLFSKLLTPLNHHRPLLRCPSTLPPLHVEYSSPNIAKPLHMGHLRSTITGKFIRNVSEFAGHDCKSVCLLGDWGRQFGVLHAGVVREKGDRPMAEYISNLSLHQLLQIYINSTKLCDTDEGFNNDVAKYSAMLESGDPECKGLWTYTRDITVDHLKSCYAKLDVHFDLYEGESEFQRDSPITLEVLQLLDSLNLTSRQSDGSLRINLSDDHHHILLKRDNSSVYLLRDIACAWRRCRTNSSQTKFIYVVDNAQGSHFQNLFETLRLIGISEPTPLPDSPFKATHTHVGFGKVTGMSTRSGNFVLLTDVINTGTEIMHESRRKSKNARNIDDLGVSESLAIAGVIVSALRVRRNSNYTFSWKEALASKGNTGVALQYGVARLRSLLEKCEVQPDGAVEEHLSVLLSDRMTPNTELLDLLVCLVNFEDTFWRTYLSLEPCLLLAYAFNLNDKISKSLASVKVVGNPDKHVQSAYVWVYGVSKNILETCMRVVGVPVLDKGF